MTLRNRRAALLAGAIAAIALAIPQARAQADKALVGSWMLVKNTTTDASGKTTDSYGASPKGRATFTADGHYSVVIMRGDLPKFASNNRLKATPEENAAIVGGMIAHYGHYTTDAKTKAIRFDIESASFPNWNGTKQDRPYSLSGGELKWTTPVASGGGRADLVWKRAK